jgi:plasmid stabilization system protein ParE
VSRRVFLTPRAEDDILRAAEQIQQYDATLASRWFTKLMRKVEGLSDSAEWHGLADEADELGVELRETFHGRKRSRYRILFVIREDTVRVLTVRRGSRDRLTADDL